MNLKKAVHLLVAYIFTSCSINALTSLNSGQPEILTNSETVTIYANDNYTLHCQGHRPLKWTLPKVEKGKQSWTKFETEFETPKNSYYEHGSRLKIFNMSYPFVGFYYCHDGSSYTNNSNISASIYLYVNDSSHLSTMDESTEQINARQFQNDVVIPCRPTSPDIQVSLLANNGSEISSKDIRYRYDPLRGFITNDTQEVYHILRQFICSFTRKGMFQELLFNMIVEPSINNLPKPEIRDLNEGHTVVGKDLLLNCRIELENEVHFEWIKANGPIDETRAQYLGNLGDSWHVLNISNATVSDSGTYYCRVRDYQAHVSNSSIDIKIFEPEAPQIINTTLQDEKKINLPEPLVLYCKVSGIPKPTLRWFKDKVEFLPSQSNRIYKDNERIIINSTIQEDEGTYECLAENKMGVASKQQIVRLRKSPYGEILTSAISVPTIVLLFLVSIGAIIYIVIRIRREKQLQKELEVLGLENFEKGAVENINPELCIEDQADLLPYDQKWEFPLERLKLGKQLGSGAFGVVMKGVAKNIIEGEDESAVAVKMVKKRADRVHIKALLSELKIMIHLGKHLNVVNLLGACTKNVVKKELLVIVEYCQFGNLQNYLLRHRNNFIDQIDPRTGKIDFTIGGEFFGSTYSILCDKSSSQAPSLNYIALKFDNSDQTVSSSISTNLDVSPEIGNNSVQLEWKSNLKHNIKPMCTKDLLAWAFQVARGMEYLASRKVLHGDLAARNILLAKNNVVKICDFGLAKNLYKNDNYKKRGDDPLPLKWMAIESLSDRIFSTQSDVWSFGIVLWEFFSLARTPYPGMEPDGRLYQKLLGGYRMESPQFAPREIYIMMTECWSHRPLARPSFTMMAERLGSLLEDPMREHYVGLNDRYLEMNTQRLKDGQTDYLAMLSSPTFEALHAPQLIQMVDQGTLNADYLNTARLPNPPSFVLNIIAPKYLNPEEGNTMEQLPILQTRCNSDFGKLLQITNGVWNSNYSLNIVKEDKKRSNNDSSNVKPESNYVPHCGSGER